MNLKLIGALLIIVGCGGMGWHIASTCRMELKTLEQLRVAVEFMQCELCYRLTPLPQLCEDTAGVSKGIIKSFFLKLSNCLKMQISPHVKSCVEATIEEIKPTNLISRYLLRMGDTLGLFDLSGQLKGLENLSDQLNTAIEQRRKDQGNRLRSYQTLGLCAGAAMAILFL